MRIVEKCSCGATIEVENANTASVQNTVTAWRGNHNHVVRPYNYPYVTYGSGGQVGGFINVSSNGAKGGKP